MRSSSFARMRARTSGRRSVTRAANSINPAQRCSSASRRRPPSLSRKARQLRQRLAEQLVGGGDHGRLVAGLRRGSRRASAAGPGHRCVRRLRPARRPAGRAASGCRAAPHPPRARRTPPPGESAANTRLSRGARRPPRHGGIPPRSAKLLGQSEAHFQKAVIDRLQFPGQQSPGNWRSRRAKPVMLRIIGVCARISHNRWGSVYQIAGSRHCRSRPRMSASSATAKKIRTGVAVAAADNAVLLVVIDGMGGHAEGARAAETALASLLELSGKRRIRFSIRWDSCTCRWAGAHEEVVKLGAGLSVEGASARHLRAVPGAGFRRLLGACGGQPGVSVEAGAGAGAHPRSQPRRGAAARGLDHRAEVHGHPMRNYVECCLGGDAALPEMSISTRRKLKSGDVLLLCTDGLWANLRDQDFVRFAQNRRQAPARLPDRSRHPGGGGLRALQRQHQCGGAALEGGVSIRPSGRAPDQLRELCFERGYTRHAEGSVLVGFGSTRCCARPASRTVCPPSCAGQGQAG